jgi:hypothetical protein
VQVETNSLVNDVIDKLGIVFNNIIGATTTKVVSTADIDRSARILE